MRKCLLLIMFITGFALTRQYLNAGLLLAPAEIPDSHTISRLSKPTHYASYCRTDFCSADLNFEEDDTKAKPVYVNHLFVPEAAFHWASQISLSGHYISFHPRSSNDLFKLNRVLRL